MNKEDHVSAICAFRLMIKQLQAFGGDVFFNKQVVKNTKLCSFYLGFQLLI